MSYSKPPFDITNEMIDYISNISHEIGRLASTQLLTRNPSLRRKNRIKTVHSTVVIEQNMLTFAQASAVLNGKRVIAPPKDIAEIKNAFEIYENMDMLNPYSEDDLLKAHSVMMRGLVDEAGYYRTKPVGVVDSESGEVIHFGTLPAYVPSLVQNLLLWLKETDVHPLIKSSVFHYEFELIHPFLDGNGRVGRLWHTLILSKWEPMFAYLPIESMIEKRQQEYYKVINHCNNVGNSTEFITFMLKTIVDMLNETIM